MSPVNFFRNLRRSVGDMPPASFAPLGEARSVSLLPHETNGRFTGSAEPPSASVLNGDVQHEPSRGTESAGPTYEALTRSLTTLSTDPAPQSAHDRFNAHLEAADALRMRSLALLPGSARHADVLQLWEREIAAGERLVPFKYDLGLGDLQARVDELRNAAAANVSPAEYIAYKTIARDRAMTELADLPPGRAQQARRAAADADTAHIDRMRTFVDDPTLTRMLSYAAGHRDAYARVLQEDLPQPPILEHPLGLVFHAPELDRQPLHMMQLSPDVDLDCGYYAYNSIAAGTGRPTMSKSEFNAVLDSWRKPHLQQSGEAAHAASVDAFTGLEELHAMLARVSPDAKPTEITDPLGVLAPAEVSRSAGVIDLNRKKAAALRKAKAVAVLAGSHWTNLQAHVDDAGRTVWHHVDSRNGRSQDIAYHADDPQTALQLHLQATLARKGRRVDSLAELAQHVDGLIAVD